MEQQSSDNSDLQPTERTRVKRATKRGHYDPETINAILDEGLVCHVGFVSDGQPYVIPMIYWREGDRLYLHGSTASRMLRALVEGASVCVTVTLIDGLVLARSAFHHSVNYRSVVVLGRARAVADDDEKMAALEALTEHVCPGRWADIRGPNAKELEATLVVWIPIDEASAKVRTGGPLDDEEDYALPVWAGVIPYAPQAGEPIDDQRLVPGVVAPDYARNYARNDERNHARPESPSKS